MKWRITVLPIGSSEPIHFKGAKEFKNEGSVFSFIDGKTDKKKVFPISTLWSVDEE